MSILRSLVFYAVFYAGTVLLVILALASALLGRRAVRAVATFWSGFHRVCAHWILGIRVEVKGAPDVQPALYAFRHESFFEAIDLPTLLSFPVIFAKKELFAIPGWGRVALMYGLLPVSRGEGATALRTMIKGARAMASTGRPLAIFPEGTRVPHGEAAPLQSGFAGLYKLLGLPIVPVSIHTGAVYHRMWKRPGTVTYRFGEPIEPGLPREEMERRVAAAIMAGSDAG
ncbi:MAG: lysophospholipid acyltransferase family protein [Novosphingobium sp.]